MTERTPQNTSAFRSLETKHTGTNHRESIDAPLTPAVTPLPKLVEQQADIAPPEEVRTLRQPITASDAQNNGQTNHHGLLHFRQWWERVEADISVFGTLISGIPIFVENNTLRVINDHYSYFIPIEKIDYIRTTDGLKSSFRSSDSNS